MPRAYVVPIALALALALTLALTPTPTLALTPTPTLALTPTPTLALTFSRRADACTAHEHSKLALHPDEQGPRPHL